MNFLASYNSVFTNANSVLNTVLTKLFDI